MTLLYFSIDMWTILSNSSSALLLFSVLFIRFLVQLSGIYQNDAPAVKGQHFMDILIVAVTVIVVAIPGMAFQPVFYMTTNKGRGPPIGRYTGTRLRDSSYAERKQPRPVASRMRDHGKRNSDMLRQNRDANSEQNVCRCGIFQRPRGVRSTPI